jgi:tRNA pseudouridine38-40 synthase
MIDDLHSAKFKMSSRTDKGVNAFANVFSFISNKKINLKAINANLPQDGTIICWAKATTVENFNPRHSDFKQYNYFIPREYVKFDNYEIKERLSIFIGKHNFQFFCKRDFRSPIRKIDQILLNHDETFYSVVIKGKSFVWEQIRRIIGAVFLSDISTKILVSLLNGVDANNSYFKIVPAPAEFLILEDIFFKDIVYETDVEALNFILNKISGKINSFFLKQYYYKKLQKITEKKL